ncbi:MAG: hypothetical protein AB7V04_04905 [Desulfomonilaceae bacterium]
MTDTKLTPKQKKWLDASKKIGRGAMTKSEREMLEKLYASMLPAEQVGLKEYIEENFGQKKDTNETVEEPTVLMEKVTWSEPSEGLKGVIAKTQRPRWLKVTQD